MMLKTLLLAGFWGGFILEIRALDRFRNEVRKLPSGFGTHPGAELVHPGMRRYRAWCRFRAALMLVGVCVMSLLIAVAWFDGSLEGDEYYTPLLALFPVIVMMPRQGRRGVRSALAVALVVVGEALVLWAHPNQLPYVGAALLVMGLAFFAELAIGAVWAGAAAATFYAAAIWKQSVLEAWVAANRPWVAGGCALIFLLLALVLASVGGPTAARRRSTLK
ncbi:hypothetical protein [Streptomyces atriruber]|uniref:hypothetical protein n=1 Tax=Streptomyces atriruber TaxID=545121 RepID=UPI0012FEBFCD|nr:hypothetical protein [Streptomyces atriruber]